MSTGFSPFQLQMGQSPCLISPLMTWVADTNIPHEDNDSLSAIALIEQLHLDVMEVQDNLLAAKISQLEFTNWHWSAEDVFLPGDKVMLSTENHHCEYMQAKSGQVTKFMPCFNRPFVVTKANPSKLVYTLELLNEPNHFATFHASLLWWHVPNNDNLFPSHALPCPGPVVTTDGEEEWHIKKILDKRMHGKGWQYLVWWAGWGRVRHR